MKGQGESSHDLEEQDQNPTQSKVTQHYGVPRGRNFDDFVSDASSSAARNSQGSGVSEGTRGCTCNSAM